jgi:phage anti-repressor protein
MFDFDMASSLVHSNKQYPVNFDDLWLWCGYSRKDNAKKVLLENFEEDFDFSLELRKTPKGGRPSELIFLTLDAAKEFAMLARTEQGKEVRKYFIEAEKKARQILNNKAEHQIQPVTEKTIEVHIYAVEKLNSWGDLQLAQLLKSRLGNLILAEQQQQKSLTSVVEQYEGAIDVAIRLGYSVPSNYESSLGRYVKRNCGDLLLGQNNRYSTSSHKQIPANMYPAHNPEIEKAVINFCTTKKFNQRKINLI